MGITGSGADLHSTNCPAHINKNCLLCVFHLLLIQNASEKLPEKQDLLHRRRPSGGKRWKIQIQKDV